MAADTLWIVMLDAHGGEIDRVAMRWGARDTLPLRRVVTESLKRDACAIIVIRQATDSRCLPGPDEMRAIDAARAVLHPVGLRLHDYLLFDGANCVSFRLTGRR